MIDKLKVQARIMERGETIGSVALKLGISPYTLGKKLSNRTIMTLDEASHLQNILCIEDEEFKDYFFVPNIAIRNKR